MEWFSKIVELLIGLAWPGALVVGLLIFKQPLISLINRLVKIGRGGAEFNLPAQTGLGDREPALKVVGPPEHLAPIFRPLQEKFEAEIKASLPKLERHFNLAGEAALIRAAGDASAGLYLERVYRLIYGSQIAAIEYLQGRSGKGRLNDLRAIYDGATKTYPYIYQSYSFEQWCNFMRTVNLIDVKGDSVALAPGGMAIVPYIAQQGYPLRPLG